jgi:hypothetical protein
MPVQKRINVNATKTDPTEVDEDLSEDASFVEAHDDRYEKYAVPMTSSPSTGGTRNPMQLQLQPLQRLRRFLKFYVSFFASASHQDQAMKVLQWTLWLLSTSCGTGTGTGTGATSGSSQARAILRKYYLDIGNVRFATRLLGFPAALEAALSGSWAATSHGQGLSSQGLYRQLGRILAISMLGYYPMEHGAYALWMLPSDSTFAAKHRTNRTAERLSAWSCRFWFIYIVAETTQCALQWKELREQQQADADADETKKSNRAATKNAIYNTQLQLTRNALFLLPCIHWALPNWDRQPWLPERVVNTLMWSESIVSLYQSVRRQPAVDVDADVAANKDE